MNTRIARIAGSLALFAGSSLSAIGCTGTESTDPPVESPPIEARATPVVTTHTASVGGVKVFYREAGDPAAPTLVLLHGFPTSSHEYRALLVDLGDKFHLIAPDYPGFGFSDAPTPDKFVYTFDHLAEVMDGLLQQLEVARYSLYVQDYGAPVGYRIAAKHPERIQSLIVQNGISYTDGLTEALAPLQAYWMDKVANEPQARAFLKPETTKFQYTQGSTLPERLGPEAWTLDQALLDRPGNDVIQLALLFDYQNNVAKFAEWQSYFRASSPPTLVVWGKNDPFFSMAAAEAYRKDLKNIEVHYLDSGHFALEDRHQEIAMFIRAFGDRVLATSK